MEVAWRWRGGDVTIHHQKNHQVDLKGSTLGFNLLGLGDLGDDAVVWMCVCCVYFHQPLLRNVQAMAGSRYLQQQPFKQQRWGTECPPASTNTNKLSKLMDSTPKGRRARRLPGVYVCVLTNIKVDGGVYGVVCMCVGWSG